MKGTAPKNSDGGSDQNLGIESGIDKMTPAVTSNDSINLDGNGEHKVACDNNQRISKEIEDLRAELDEDVKQLGYCEANQKPRAELALKVKDMQGLRKQSEEMQLNNDGMRKQNDLLQAKSDSMVKQNKDLQAKNDDLVKKNEELRTNVDRMGKRNEELQAKKTKWNQELQAKNDGLKKQNEELQAKNDGLTKKIEEPTGQECQLGEAE
ncbi:puff II/9-2 protein-like isoform X2 [Panicum virgatum]|uniref:puff II/9-2 protein-like isoform X2 n=1 Tax=Panicum virgatum TaxID=38727 RepID=UPI0019D58643|nr:puff II/9-2 protein-like isoform X2 [Panicum virgatum]